MEIAIAIAALGVAAVSFFYNIGRDTKDTKDKNTDDRDEKLDQIYASLSSVDKKIDRIVDWQMEATGIHERHGEQIKTLFNKVTNLENRMEDRAIMTDCLKKILEKVG